MTQFHIVDTDLKVINSSRNELSLQADCDRVNNRFYQEDEKCFIVSSEELKVFKQIKG